MSDDRDDREADRAESRRRVTAYYEATHGIYQTFWSRHALHYGLWDEATRSHSEALAETNRYVGRRLSPAASHHVLDAGCGVGETGRTLARTFGCRVTGVTLSPRQARTAQTLTRRAGLEDLVDTRVADYHALPFDDGVFDAAFGLESICHAHSKPGVVRELARVVRPGGRVLIVDGWLAPRTRSLREERLYRQLLAGWEIEALATPPEIVQAMGEAGLRGVELVDLTARVLPTARYMDRLMRLLYLPVGLPARLGLLPRRWYVHGQACFAQRVLFEEGTMVYGAVIGRR